MTKQKALIGKAVLAAGFFCLLMPSSASALNDTYNESFDSRQSNVSIDGTDSWSVQKGPEAGAFAQSDTTARGAGRALKITGDEDALIVARTAPLGGLSPTWIEYSVNPGLGEETPAVPAEGIGAVSFNHTREVLAANGSSWVSTGVTFDPGQWYKVLMKIDFTTKLYDVYVWPANLTKVPFIADKQSLRFIDSSISSVSELGFKGVFNPNDEDDTYVDDLLVHYVQRLHIVTPVQTIVKENASDLITVQLQNANSEPQTAWEDISLDLLSSSPAGEFSLSPDPWESVSQIIIPEGSQEVSFYYKDAVPGKPVINIKENPARGFQEVLHQLTVVGEIKLFDVSAVSPQVAGRPFQITVTAKDDDGSVNQSYAGMIQISALYVSPASGTLQISPDQFSGFKEGVAQISVSYPDAGSISILVEDTEDASKKGSTGSILFVPAKLTVNAEGGFYKVSEEFNLTVSALNEQEQVTPNYKGPVLLSPLGVSPSGAGGGVLSPSQLTGEFFQNGSAEIPVSYDYWGSIQIGASDQADPNLKAQSSPVLFSPHAVSVKLKPHATRNYFYTGENFEVTVQVVDLLGQPIRNFSGLVDLSSEPDLGMPGQYSFLEADGGKKSFILSASSAGAYKVRAKSIEYNLDAESPAIQIQSATVEVISTTAPVGTTEVEIQLLDDQGKRIRTENDVTITLVVHETDGNNSYFSPSLDSPVTFRNGVAKIIIGNSEAETLRIGVETKYGFEVKTGTVTFGKIGKSGIGALMWWESKDDDAGDDEEEKKDQQIQDEALRENTES